MSSFAEASPVVGRKMELRQPDGAMVQVKVWGDEYYQEVESLDGYTLVRDPANQIICYARLSADGNTLLSTGVRARQAMDAPTATELGITPHLRISAAARRAQAAAARAAKTRQMEQVFTQGAQKTAQKTGRAPSRPLPPVQSLKPSAAGGPLEIRGLCLLIDFPDQPGTITPADVDNFFNQTGYTGFGNNGSVRDYYSDITRGGFIYTNTVTTYYYRAKHNKSYYDDPTDILQGKAARLLDEALTDLDQKGFDFSPYDANHDGYIDAINAYYAGWASAGWCLGLWPHMGATYLELDGVIAGYFQMADLENGPRLGPVCHENGHLIFRWPDLYDYDYDSRGVGNYCLMATGCFLGDERNPGQPCAYLKSLNNITQPVALTSPQAGLTVTAGMNQTYRYDRPGHANEFYLIENRQKTGRDAGLPDAGLAVWHIDTKGNRDSNEMTSTSHYVVTLTQADGRWDLEHNENDGDAGDLFDGASVSQFYDDSTPTNTHWWDGSRSGLDLNTIGALGATMTFNFGQPYDVQAGPRTPQRVRWFVGSPDPPARICYTLTNSRTTALDWTTSVSAASTWLTPVKAAGHLAPGTSETVELALSPSGLTVGAYAAAIQFLDQSTQNGPRREVAFDIESFSFKWGVVASPQVNGQPFAARIAAVDGAGTTLTQYSRPATLSAERQITIGQELPANSLYPFIMDMPTVTNANDSRTQVIYLASEVGAAGLLRGLELKTTTPSAQPMNNFTVRIKHTALTQFSGNTWVDGPWTTVYQSNLAFTSAGWVRLDFTTPFNYNGTDNLLVDFSVNNSFHGAETLSIGYDTGSNRLMFCYTSGAYGDPLNWSGGYPFVAKYHYAPFVRFFRSVPLAPSATGAFVNGVWNGLVTVGGEATELVLHARDDSGNSGSSNIFEVSAPLWVSPAAGFAAGGPAGGLFVPESRDYTLTNLGATPLNWTAAKSADWLTLSQTAGTLAPGAAATVRAGLAPGAADLATGTYQDTITFTDVGRAAAQTRPASLAVRPISGFKFTPIASPQTVFEPFAVRIAAVDAQGTTATRYTGSAALTGPKPMTPDATGNFAAGVWTGQLTVMDESASLVLQARDDAADLRGDSNAFRVSAPFVRRVTSSHPDGVFTVGEVIDIDVVFSSAIQVGGTPTLQLETGASDRVVNCLGLVTTDTLRFRYVVGAGEMNVRLDVLSVNALNLGGGWVRDAASGTHNAVLTLPAPGSPGSLRASRAITIDTSPPSVTLSSTAPEPTNLSPIPLRVVFSRPVSGFTAGDITVSNANVTGFSGAGTTYTLGLVPIAQGGVIVSVAAGVAQDSGGVGNAPAPALLRTYHSQPPGFSIVAIPALAGPGATVQICLIASESLSGNPTVTVNGHATALQSHNSNLSYVFTYQVRDEGYEGPALLSTTGTDLISNTGVSTNTTALRIDTLGPCPTVTGPPSPASASPVSFTIAYHEAVSSFDGSGITISGGVRGTLTARGDGKTFDLPVTPDGRGEVTCQVPAGAARDTLGNRSSVGGPAVVRFDNDPTAARLVRYLLGTGNEDPSGLNLNGDHVINSADLVWLLRYEPPLVPASPSPAAGALNVSVGTALDWSDCPRTRAYRVYLWPAGQLRPAQPTFSGLSLSATTPQQPLAFGTKYSWLVVAAGDNSVTTGPLWSFTTAGNPVQVASPNGGQAWQLGKTAQVHWRLNTSVAGTQVRLELWRGGARAADLGLFTNPAGDATSNVTVPFTLTPARDYRVRAVSTKLEQAFVPVPWDESDGMIELKP